MAQVLLIATNEKIMNGHTTGLWAGEIVEPMEVFKKNNIDFTVASILGGEIPIDPNSINDAYLKKYKQEMSVLKNTKKIADLNLSDFQAIYFSGGHGTMIDFYDSELIAQTINTFLDNNKYVAAVCHGVSALCNVKRHGKWLVENVNLTGFTNTEEVKAKLDQLVPFSLEDVLLAQNAKFSKGPDFSSYTITDDKILTGQNPQSSTELAEVIVKMIKK